MTLSPGLPIAIENGTVAVYLVLSGTIAAEFSETTGQQRSQQGELAIASAHATLRAGASDSCQPHESNHASATLLIARFQVSGHGHPLADLLPPYLSSVSGEAGGPLADPSFSSWLAARATAQSPGSVAVASRFLQSLLVELLRSFLQANDGLRATQTAASTGAYQATFDACLGPVMRLVHAAPHRDWTVHSMARESGLSRSAFADRFRTVVGQPPLQYVTEIRMQKAAELLEMTDIPVKRIAAQVGYESVSAFSSAFKRRFGVPPISLRQSAANTSDQAAD